MIFEGLITTLNENGSVNISPMGPRLESLPPREILLQPFHTSQTLANLRRTGEAVFHITDDVLLLAQAVIHRIQPEPALTHGSAVACPILADACRWYALKLEKIEETHPRVNCPCRVVEMGCIRDFWGFNRGKNAVVELAILASRVEILPAAEIKAQIPLLKLLVEKTGGEAERQALQLLLSWFEEKLPR